MDQPSQERFGRFVAERGQSLFRAAYLLTGNRDEAEDLVQSTLERLAGRFAAAERATSMDAYVRRILVNLATDTWRAKRRRPQVTFGQPAEATLEAATPDPGGLVADRAVVVDLLRSLPPRQRTALVLRYWLGLTDREIAETMGCAVGTVKSQLSRGMDQLRLRWTAEPQPAVGLRGDHRGH